MKVMERTEMNSFIESSLEDISLSSFWVHSSESFVSSRSTCIAAKAFKSVLCLQQIETTRYKHSAQQTRSRMWAQNPDILNNLNEFLIQNRFPWYENII